MTFEMRSKPATLATAGKRLTGPPEGYGRKKEMQVKHWLVGSAQHTSVADAAASGGGVQLVPSARAG